MTIPQAGEPTPRKLRLWPGVIAVVLLWVSRFGVKAVVPGIQGFGMGMMAAFAFTLVVLIWWTFFSRTRWSERLSAIGLVALALGGTWLLRHESMWMLWLLGYAIPVLCLAFVIWAVATQRLPERLRRATMVATILLSCGAWLLVRENGINGDHIADFGWRWAASPEERLLAQTPDQPAAVPLTPAVATTSVAPVSGAPAASPSVAPPTQAARDSASLTAHATSEKTQAEWPGFRGPRRDGIVRGVRIKTDWSGSPPIQLWRRPVGPGWSSFAVAGDLLYTQEQRGDDEVVACYKASTGQPVWAHRDKARFFESNAGAGPRGTPTLSNGRVYTFGATGILNVLDAASGAVVWSRNVATETGTKVPFWGFSSSPLVMGDAVIVAASGQLVAYDGANGNRRWVGPSFGNSYSSPHLVTIDGVAQVLLMSGSGVISVAPGDGKQIWEHQWPGNSIVQPALTSDGDVLITSQESGTRSIAVAHNSGGWSIKEKWTSNGLKPYFNDFVVHKGHVFGFDGRILACIDLKDGQRK